MKWEISCDWAVPPGPTLTPTNLVATTILTGQIDLIWQGNASDEAAYHIERSTGGINWTETDTIPADTIFYSDIGLDCSTNYHYRIRGYRTVDISYSGYSNVAQTTTEPCFIKPVYYWPLFLHS